MPSARAARLRLRGGEGFIRSIGAGTGGENNSLSVRKFCRKFKPPGMNICSMWTISFSRKAGIQKNALRPRRSTPAVKAVSKRQGFFEYAAPFLHMAEDYFLHPPEDLERCSSLEALLDEAFLAHRLLEEVNDHHVRQLGRALMPMDMTEANIIVHHLLGDEFAMRLEELVQFTASQLLDKEHVWEQVRDFLPGDDRPLLSSTRVGGPDRRIRLNLAS